MSCIAVAGYSGCGIVVRRGDARDPRDGGCRYVLEKASASEAYNPRLQKQIDKQVAYGERLRALAANSPVASPLDAVGGDLSGLLASLVDRGLDPDFDAVLRTHGLRLVLRDRNKPWLGLSLKLNSTEVAFVYDHSPAWESGIAPGDELIAIQGMRITETNLNTVLQSVADIGRPLCAITATRGLLQEVSLVPVEHPFGVPAVEFDPDATPAACALRSKWLGDDVSAR